MEATTEALVGLVRTRRQAGESRQSRWNSYEDRPRASVPGRPRHDGGGLIDLIDRLMVLRSGNAPSRGDYRSW